MGSTGCRTFDGELRLRNSVPVMRTFGFSATSCRPRSSIGFDDLVRQNPARPGGFGHPRHRRRDPRPVPGGAVRLPGMARARPGGAVGQPLAAHRGPGRRRATRPRARAARDPARLRSRAGCAATTAATGSRPWSTDPRSGGRRRHPGFETHDAVRCTDELSQVGAAGSSADDVLVGRSAEQAPPRHHRRRRARLPGESRRERVPEAVAARGRATGSDCPGTCGRRARYVARCMGRPATRRGRLAARPGCLRPGRSRPRRRSVASPSASPRPPPSGSPAVTGSDDPVELALHPLRGSQGLDGFGGLVEEPPDAIVAYDAAGHEIDRIAGHG